MKNGTPADQPSIGRMLAEYDMVVEELRDTDEEVRAVNHQLIETQEALSAERDRYRALFESTPVAYLVTDSAGTIQEANQRAVRLLGAPHRFLVGKPLTNFVAVEQRAALRRQLAQLGSIGEGQQWALQLQPRRRAPVSASATVRVACDGAGRVREVHWLFHEGSANGDAARSDLGVAIEVLSEPSNGAGDGPTMALDGIAESLGQLVEQAVRAVAADGGALAVIDRHGAIRWVTATSGAASSLARIEQGPGEEPGSAAFRDGRPVVVSDLRLEPRWSRIGQVAAAHGIRALLVVPVRIGQQVLGTLMVVSASQRMWSEGDTLSTSSYASILGRLLATGADAATHRRRADQLQYALNARVVIEQAKGVLMERKQLPPCEAFEQLRRLARSSGRRLSDVAAEIIADSSSRP